MRRSRMSRIHSKKNFRHGAVRVNHKNAVCPMRGGWRL